MPPPLQAFSSAKRDPRAPLSTSVHKRAADETCAFYGALDIRGCRLPRQITACLQRQHCVFTQAHCEDASAATNTSSFSGSGIVDINGSAAFYYQLASDATVVCASSDTSCRSCSSDLSRSLQNSSVQCIGEGGCLCEDLILFLDSNSTSSSSYQCGAGYRYSDKMGTLAWFAFFLCVSVLLISACSSSQRKAARIAAQALERQATRALHHLLDLVPVNFQLDLFGWRLHQRHLRYKERLLLQGYENLSPITAPIDYAGSPSAPDFDVEEEASAPTKHDPMALASAPAFTLRYEHEASREGTAVSFAIPTAPDFHGVHGSLDSAQYVRHEDRFFSPR